MVKINFQTEKGKSSVWIPKDTILQVVRNTGTYKQEDENGEMVEKEIDFLNVTLKEKVKLRKPASPDFIPSHFGSLSNLFPIKKLDSGKIVYEKLGEDPIEFTVDKMLEIFTKKIENTNPTLTNNYQQLAVEIGTTTAFF